MSVHKGRNRVGASCSRSRRVALAPFAGCCLSLAETVHVDTRAGGRLALPMSAGAAAPAEAPSQPSAHGEGPGRPSTLDDSQRSALAQLRSELLASGPYDESTLPDDAYLCRFLRAREFNVAKTREMLVKVRRSRAHFRLIFRLARLGSRRTSTARTASGRCRRTSGVR